MTGTQLDPRAAAWLDLGPSRAPADSFDAIMAAVDTAPQAHPHLRLRGRPVAFTPRMLAAAAAIVVAVSAVGGYVLRDPILDVLAPPPGDLLAAFPETRSIMKASGGPEGADRTVVIGTLPKDEAFVIAATCTGGASMPVEVWDRAIQYGPDTTEADKQPNKRLDVPCDGSIVTTGFATDRFASDEMELTADVPSGATWRIAVGQLRARPVEPSFPALDLTEGTVLMIDAPATFTYGHPGAGIGLQPPPAGEIVTVLVQCLGDPVTVTNDAGMPPVQLDCADAGVTTAIDMPVPSAATVYAGTDGFAWVRMAVEAPTGPAEAGRPTAPPMPAGIGDVAFAEGDGQNVAFGTLGSNAQQVVRVADSLVGHGAGDVVGISRKDGDGAVLELWSMRDAAPIRTLATVDGGTIFDSWVDATHEQVFYGITRLGGHEYRRVGFDGTGDTSLASGIGPIRYAQAVMAVDDAQFVAEWCPVVGSCERAIHDAATGETRQVTFEGDPVCSINGVLDGRIVATTSQCDVGVDDGVIAVRDLDGGEWTTLLDGWVSVILVDGSDGPQAVLVRDEGRQTVVLAVSLDATGLREVATFDHEEGMGPVPSRVRLPAGDWVLLAGPIGDTPVAASVGGGPLLLNIVTGERIELRNLPGY